MATILTHQVIDGCDTHCRFCNLWTKGLDPRPPLTLDQIATMLEDGARVGLRSYVVYGGEPLLRDDIGAILAAAKSFGYQTFLCSNSLRLEERADEVGPHLDVFLCSIDGSAAVHDRMRNTPGLLDQALVGMQAIKRHGCDIRFWTHLHRDNAADVMAVAELAQAQGVGVDFFPTHEVARGARRMVLDEATRIATFEEALRGKALGLPIRTSAEALQSARDDTPFRCMWPTEAVYVAPDGAVYPCERVYADEEHRLGNVVADGIANIVASEAFARYAAELEACNACRLPCVMQVSLSPPTKSRPELPQGAARCS